MTTLCNLTANSTIIVDSNKSIDELIVGNSATTGGAIKFNEGTNNGSNFVALKAFLTTQAEQQHLHYLMVMVQQVSL